jgi:hypothetical protein
MVNHQARQGLQHSGYGLLCRGCIRQGCWGHGEIHVVNLTKGEKKTIKRAMTFLSLRVHLWEIIPQILPTHNMICSNVSLKQLPAGWAAQPGCAQTDAQG